MSSLSLHRMLLSSVAGWTALWASARDSVSSPAVGSDTDDAEVVKRFQETRDGQLFEILVGRYKDRIFRLALSVLGASAEAEAQEVTQEVFVKVFRQISGFRGESRFSTWLYRIAYREAVDRKRQARSRLPHVGLAELLERPAQGLDPQAEAESRERRRTVQLCLEGLPDVYRSALYLYYWMDHPVEEIAELLGVPAGTVKSYLHRGRRMLFRELQKRGLSYGEDLR